MNIKKIQLGKLLLDRKLITEDDLNKAIAEQKTSGHKLGQVMVDRGLIKEDALFRLLSEQLQIPYIDLKNYLINPDVLDILPEDYARRYHCIVLNKDEHGLLIGMSDPQDVLAYDDLVQILNQPIRLALVRDHDLNRILDVHYRHAAEISHLAEKLSVELGKEHIDLAQLGEGLSISEAPVVKLLQSIFNDAVQVNASDIHIEPDEKVLRIRLRIDGVLHESIVDEVHIAEALALRLKIMGGLNIAEKRLPQDGRFSLMIRNQQFDVRLSTMPSQHGESIVMRLLNQSASLLNLNHLGMPNDLLNEIHKIMALPNGLLLITGPTGSGKTTSLYGMLTELNKPDIKIITVEDPIEYRLPRITQVQVNSKIDLDFARVLRSSLRQDPDVIMIGELRDQESVTIAIRAAMTGHFVFATLHTNDAISSAVRLLDMGAEGYLIATVLRGIIAQRLLRRICPDCIEDYTPTPEEMVWLESIKNNPYTRNTTFKRGAGCTYCYHTGYKGRIGVFELLVMNATLCEALRKNDSAAFVKAAENAPYYKPLLLSAIELAAKGITTISEVIYVAGEL